MPRNVLKAALRPQGSTSPESLHIPTSLGARKAIAIDNKGGPEVQTSVSPTGRAGEKH
jgi:hypothetical protein